MSDQQADFLDRCNAEGVAVFRRLIVQMSAAGVSKIVLTDHPDYDFNLGISGTDVGYWSPEGSESSVELIANCRDRLSEFLQASDPLASPHIGKSRRWTWIRNCWLAAGGRDSGCLVAIFENGTGDMIDLNTGEKPEQSLGFDDIV